MTSSATARRVGMYRLRKTDGTLLYIGIGYDPALRIAAHRREKTWWPDVDAALTTIEWLADREIAEAAELAAIRDEKPLHNIVTGDEHGCARFLPVPAGHRRGRLPNPRGPKVAVNLRVRQELKDEVTATAAMLGLNASTFAERAIRAELKRIARHGWKPPTTD